MRKLLALVAFALVAAVASAASAQPYQLALGGASPGGLWTLLGVGIDRAVKASYPGSTVTYQTSGGGFANVLLLEQRRVQIGLVHNAELRLAINGEEPFRQRFENLVVIGTLYNWAPMQFLLARDFAERHNIRSFEDLAARRPPLRVALNRRGNIAEMVAERMFRAIGVSNDTIRQWGGTVVLAASEEQSDLMRDRRVDGLFNSLFVGQRSLIEVGQALPVVMLPIGRPVIERVAQEMGIEAYEIPANSYTFQTEAVPTLTLGVMLMANRNAMSDQDAYNLARALTENVALIRDVHPAMRALTPEFLAQQGAGTFHPGARRFYQERNLIRTGS